MTTLAQARARVRRYADDDDELLGDDDVVDEALQAAQEEVWLLAVSSGTNRFNTEADVTSDANGVIDLSALKPAKLINVAEYRAGARYVVQPVRHADALVNATVSMPIRIQYVPSVTYPAADADPFVWGDPSLRLRVLDDLMCLIAAASLKITEAETNRALEQRKQELKLAAISQLNLPSFYTMPLADLYSRRRTSPYRYVATSPFTLQLCR